ncbi:39530_t:CDS:2 [Gigaspora margarita]|uniref:39530_t:CDS:1 n=1 Tax=Gigaspora margarita TaxID=4874 RepID=A0ABN7VRH0_GIGMA|nr:39530_t:CDS:2 [Gigaspora margarita]
MTKPLMKNCTSNKKHNTSEKENSSEWAIPMTRLKKSITKLRTMVFKVKKIFKKKLASIKNITKLLMKLHQNKETCTTDSNDEITKKAKTKNYDANEEENSPKWATPTTRPKKSITKTENNSIQTIRNIAQLTPIMKPQKKQN